jgi:hypothetical protein
VAIGLLAEDTAPVTSGGATIVRLLACWPLAVGALAQDTAQITSGGATIEVTFEPRTFEVGRASVLAWISNAANAATEYFGRFPVQHPRVMVRPAEGLGGVFHGTTFGGRGGFTDDDARVYPRGVS